MSVHRPEDSADSRIGRRSLLLGGAGTAGLALAGSVAAPGLATPARSRRIGDPFTLGVASGDPTTDGFVLWTRLAPEPLAGDGLGGMPARKVEVRWELAADARFRKVLRRGRATALPQNGHAVHVELGGLAADTEYFYRFRTTGSVGEHFSPIGRTLTTPPAGSLGRDLLMCFASCSQFEHGYFTAYRRMAEDNPDLILHLGDYLYEYKANDYTIEGGNIRDHAGPETVTLAGYRQRHAQYRLDSDLQAAHAAAPWLVVWDDHEFENNWADEIPEDGSETPGRAAFLARRKAAFKAYYENMPLRRAQRPRGIDLLLYRRLHWGRLATFHMLDTRQYRDDQPCGDEFGSNCAAMRSPDTSLTGDAQEAWLTDGFRRSDARWDVLGQQVFFAKQDFDPGPAEAFNPDAWDGYTVNRDRIRDAWVDTKVRNALVLTGDVHASWGNNITADFADPDSKIVGSELVGTSITSGGDGSERNEDTAAMLAENPHIKFFNNRRGYIRTRFGRDAVRADFRGLDRVSQPGARAVTKGAFVIEDRDPGLKPA